MPRNKPIGLLRDLETFEEVLVAKVRELIKHREYEKVKTLSDLVVKVGQVSHQTLNLEKNLREELGLVWLERISRKTVAEGRSKHRWECGFSGCTYRQKGLGYCQGHLDQLKLGNNLTPLVNYKRKDKGCLFPDCPKPHSAKGYCDGHRKQQKLGKQLTPLWPRTSKGRKCNEPGCEDDHAAKGKCKRHYEEFFVRGKRKRDQLKALKQ